MNLLLLSDTSDPSDDVKKAIDDIIQRFGKKVAYISSSFQDEDRPWFHNTWNEYKKIVPDIELEYFDLSNDFSDSKLKESLDNNIVHLSGGNTFFFLYHMKKRGFDRLLKEYTKNSGNVLIGVSAGSIIMTPTIRLCSWDKLDSNDVGLKDLGALGLVDFEFYPHYEKSEKEDEYLKKYVEKHKTKMYVCTDKDGLWLKNEEIIKLGKPQLIE
jgi:dipeptidase E